MVKKRDKNKYTAWRFLFLKSLNMCESESNFKIKHWKNLQKFFFINFIQERKKPDINTCGENTLQTGHILLCNKTQTILAE